MILSNRFCDISHSILWYYKFWIKFWVSQNRIKFMISQQLYSKTAPNKDWPPYTIILSSVTALSIFSCQKYVLKWNRKTQFCAKKEKSIKLLHLFCAGGVLPQGIPFGQSSKLICQRFSKDGMLGKTLGYKDDHYATLYDTSLRMPIMSMTTVHVLADEKWPNVPYMMEQGSTHSTFKNATL